MKLTPTLGGSLSGSLGGLTASHNRGGQYLRRRSVPVNPNTARQQAVRAILGSLVQAWSDDLTESERQAWRDYAAAVPRTDVLGQTITLTGQQWFIATNTPRLQQELSGLTVAGNGVVSVAPTTFNTGEAVASLTEFSILDTGPVLVVTGVLAAPASDDGFALLYFGRPVNPGVRFYKGPYQFGAAVAVAAAATTFAFTIDPSDSLEWAAAFQPAEANIDVFFGLRLILSYDDGRTSQEFRQLTALSQGV